MDDRRKVSSYLINKDYQGKFLLIFGSIGVLQTFVFFYAVSQIFGTLRSQVELLPPDQMLALINQMQGSVNMLFGGVFVLLLVTFIIVGFRFTHKTAGALYHMQRTFMESEKQGSLQEMKMRDGDFFREVEQAYNDMVKKLK